MTRKIDPVGKEGKRVALEVSAPFSTLRAIFSLVKSLRPSGFEKSLSHQPSLSRVSLPLFESVLSYYFMCYLL